MAIVINNPACIYRLQFHKQFSFHALEHIIPYLQKLGVQTIYASPIFKAVPGSKHGYDGINPLEINCEIGSLEQFKKIVEELKKQGMGWLQDIVPNHLAFHHSNIWLMDVLEKGKQSAYAPFFDIDLESKVYGRKLMVPFLATAVPEILQKDELKLAYQNRRIVLKYYDSFYPLNSSSYITVLFSIDQQIPAIKQLIADVGAITGLKDINLYFNQWEEFLLKLDSLQQDKNIHNYIKNCLKKINSDNRLLQQVIDQQFYHLCHWQETDTKINYRRFFTVNGLICINIQDKNVFDRYHQLVGSLVKEDCFQGLRVDHIDGLYDPTGYLELLRKLTGEQTYILVEKILQPGESLPDRWKVQGSTGYDFLVLVNKLLTQKTAEKKFCSFYEQFENDHLPIKQQLLEKKALNLYQHMAGELDNLYELLVSILDKKLLSSIYPQDMKEAIGEFLIHFPVYRYYPDKFPLDATEESAIENILSQLRKNGKADVKATDILQKTLLELPKEANEDFRNKLLHFYRRCMQFTGPLMAKGLEDTFMYTYNRFIGHNDVGDSPLTFGISKDEFHKAMIERQKRWPLSLNTTSTHDTKRGEDVRARLNVLTDLPEEWFTSACEWKRMNAKLKENNIPNAGEEYFIYQSLIGAYPMPGCNERNFIERLQEYLEKALREAKINSNWVTPNQTYETTVKNFASNILRNADFCKSFHSFHQKIADFGIANSLAQLLLKFTCPGVPDVYQGCELWDLSFVDPDNRRTVNFNYRLQILNAFDKEKDKKKLIETLWKQRNNGHIKLWLTQNLSKLRKQLAKFFQAADYIPLKVNGEYSDFIFAFARQYQQQCLIVAVPFHLAQLCKEQQTDILSIDWKDTHIVPPRRLRETGEDILLNQELQTDRILRVEKLFRHLPIAILKTEKEENNGRN